MFWKSSEEVAADDGNALTGKTLTVFLDPEQKHTLDDFTTTGFV